MGWLCEDLNVVETNNVMMWALAVHTVPGNNWSWTEYIFSWKSYLIIANGQI